MQEGDELSSLLTTVWCTASGIQQCTMHTAVWEVGKLAQQLLRCQQPTAVGLSNRVLQTTLANLVVAPASRDMNLEAGKGEQSRWFAGKCMVWHKWASG